MRDLLVRADAAVRERRRRGARDRGRRQRASAFVGLMNRRAADALGMRRHRVLLTARPRRPRSIDRRRPARAHRGPPTTRPGFARIVATRFRDDPGAARRPAAADPEPQRAAVAVPRRDRRRRRVHGRRGLLPGRRRRARRAAPGRGRARLGRRARSPRRRPCSNTASRRSSERDLRRRPGEELGTVAIRGGAVAGRSPALRSTALVPTARLGRRTVASRGVARTRCSHRARGAGRHVEGRRSPGSPLGARARGRVRTVPPPPAAGDGPWWASGPAARVGRSDRATSLPRPLRLSARTAC